MIGKGKKRSLLFIMVVLLVMPLISSREDAKRTEEAFLNKVEWALKSMSNYEKQAHFVHHILFGYKWNNIRKSLQKLKSKIGIEITGENINTAEQQFEFINREINDILKQKTDNLLVGYHLRISPILMAIGNLNSMVVALMSEALGMFGKHNDIDREESDVEQGNNCPEERVKYGKAVMAMENAGLYQNGSSGYVKYATESLRLFYDIARSDCLSEQNSMKKFARQVIDQKKQRIQITVSKLKTEPLEPEERQALLHSVGGEEMLVFEKLDPQWVEGLNFDINRFPRADEYSELDHKKNEEEHRSEESEVKSEGTETVTPLRKADLPEVVPGPVQAPGDFFPLTLDVWQSAWGVFEKLDVLIAYLNRNNIKKINLNPGLPMGPKFYDESYQKFKPLVDKFHAGGIKKIAFLYAELNYPIEFFAKFLARYRRELKIDTIVDDSEFVDIFRNRFENNIRKVKQYGIKYSAFVTLESIGNSGVSDTTRYWVIDHVDYPILMSYFGCTLSEQKAKLEKYLQYADRRGIRRRVSIAILLGNKKVGREESCERLLTQAQMQHFLKQLHDWAYQNHPSYGGITLETNLKMPKFDLDWR